MSGLTYGVVSPVRDEAENLRRVAACLLAQTTRPAAWVIVDNGSSDATAAVAAELSVLHEWITAVEAKGEERAVPGAPIVRAFHAGLAALDVDVDVVVKLDADVTFGPDYFARTLDAFEQDARLGITGGACWELAGASWAPVPTSGDHVRGAVRCYRSALLRQIAPLPERTGWDTIDEFQAVSRGWVVGVDDSLRFNHHRTVGARDGGRAQRWLAKGDAARFLGYRPSYLVGRSLYQARRDPFALAMIWGFARAAFHRATVHPEAEARALLRDGQRLRVVSRRRRAA